MCLWEGEEEEGSRVDWRGRLDIGAIWDRDKERGCLRRDMRDAFRVWVGFEDESLRRDLPGPFMIDQFCRLFPRILSFIFFSKATKDLRISSCLNILDIFNNSL